MCDVVFHYFYDVEILMVSFDILYHSHREYMVSGTENEVSTVSILVFVEWWS